MFQFIVVSRRHSQNHYHSVVEILTNKINVLFFGKNNKSNTFQQMVFVCVVAYHYYDCYIIYIIYMLEYHNQQLLLVNNPFFVQSLIIKFYSSSSYKIRASWLPGIAVLLLLLLFLLMSSTLLLPNGCNLIVT